MKLWRIALPSSILFFLGEYIDSSGAVSLLGALFWLPTSFKLAFLEKQKPEKVALPQKPPIKQTLSSKQLTSLSESYNLKLYKQIANN